MGKYLEIAQIALSTHASNIAEDDESTKDQSLTTEVGIPSLSTHCEISELSEISPERAYEATDHELKAYLGDEWTEVEDDEEQIKAIRCCLTEAKLIERGIVPRAFTDITDCKYCGPVFIYPGYPNPANNCPWCFNRLRGLPIPRVQSIHKRGTKK